MDSRHRIGGIIELLEHREAVSSIARSVHRIVINLLRRTRLGKAITYDTPQVVALDLRLVTSEELREEMALLE